MWWPNIVLLASHKNFRKKLLFFNISNHILSKIMIRLRRSNSLQGIKLMALTNFNIHLVQSTSKNGWGQNMQLCLDLATKLFKWISRTIRRYFWIPKIGLSHTSIKRARDQQCHSIRLSTATTLRWQRDWNTRKIFWRTCWTTINSSKIHQADRLLLKSEFQIQPAEVLEVKQPLECPKIQAEEVSRFQA